MTYLRLGNAFFLSWTITTASSLLLVHAAQCQARAGLDASWAPFARVVQAAPMRRLAQVSPDEAAPGMPPPSEAEVQSWWNRLRVHIQQQMSAVAEVPQDAQVELEVSLMPSGLPADIATRRTSGYPTLDAAVRRAVMAATPLPLPADPAAYARVRRFAVHYEPRAGVRIAEPRAVPEAIPPAPTLTAAEPFICRAGDLPVAAAPSCQESGSRSELLTCFAQAVKLRTSQVVSVCKADVYPAEARRHMLEGTAHIGVSYDRGGKLGAVSIAESSGQPMLDQRALDLVRQSVLPAPSELYATPFAVRIPVVFRMQRSDDVSTGWAPAAGAASSGKREGQARQPRMGTRSSATPTSSSKAKRAAAKAKKKNKTKKKKRASTQT